MRPLIATTLATLLLALGVTPATAAAAAEPGDPMTADKAQWHYLRTMCRLDGRIAVYNAAEPATLPEARRESRRLGMALTNAASGLMEPPAAWPDRPNVLPGLQRLVGRIIATGNEARKAADARTVTAWQRAARATARKAVAMRGPVTKLNRKFDLPHDRLSRNCYDFGLI